MYIPDYFDQLEYDLVELDIPYNKFPEGVSSKVSDSYFFWTEELSNLKYDREFRQLYDKYLVEKDFDKLDALILKRAYKKSLIN